MTRAERNAYLAALVSLVLLALAMVACYASQPNPAPACVLGCAIVSGARIASRLWRHRRVGMRA